ncbi:MAG: precorrin-6A reductase [Lachnospiraceae bacterium]|nr:precorrin-6A reductase [Lachnospiraceae bacterium]
MNRVLIFAGTTEGRTLSEYLSENRIEHMVCVATEYGEEVLSASPYMTIHQGRMDVGEMEKLMQTGSFAAVVDATHPYAVEVTANIRKASQEAQLPYLRLKRCLDTETEGRVFYFHSNEECVDALEKTEGNILLTTGSKELATYCSHPLVKERLYVRVLPGMESISICTELGIKGKQMIAMQGPFSTEMNEAILHQFEIACMVTKKSGRLGGYPEKLEAAKRAGIPVYVIEPADTERGYSMEEVCERLQILLCAEDGVTAGVIDNKMDIILAGIGMGASKGLTREVYDAIESADILLGAKRLIEPYKPHIEKKPYYLGKDIVPYLENLFLQSAGKRYRVVVLFSGDSGSYSGCQALAHCLHEAVAEKRFFADIRILPGISSVSYLASCIGESYHDAAILSMHGKLLPGLARRIQENEKTFLFMSGVKDMRKLGTTLTEAFMDDCIITAGYQLSYEDEEIRKLTPKECLSCEKEGLYICFIYNPHPKKIPLTPGIADEEFIRGKVPMTKKEIREVSICKLHLHPGAVVYDIGSGTGSVAVEMAEMSPDIEVYALEQKPEAIELIEKNKEKIRLDNITVIQTKAPEGLMDLKMPTHAFIGGSGGKMKEIIETLYQINPGMRIVINAVSIETLCEIKEILMAYPVCDTEFVQLQVSRVKELGAYHMMQAENPIFVCAFTFCD